MPNRYRKKAVEVEAVQRDGSEASQHEMLDGWADLPDDAATMELCR